VRLGLALRRDGDAPFPARHGIDFVGWCTWWSHRVRRRRTLGSVTTRLDAFERRHWRAGPVQGAQSLALVGERAERAVEHLRTSLASSAGHLQHASAWRAWAETWARHPWLDDLFARDGWGFAPRWASPLRLRPLRFAAQYRQLVARAGERTLVFCPVGRFVEFYGPQRLVAERTLGLRGIYRPRAGYGFAVGFPRRLAWRFLGRAVDAGCAALVVGVASGTAGIFPRWPVRLVVPS
jgi:hypothetical protein